MNARNLIRVALAAVFALSACRGGFRINRFPNSESLYGAALREYQAERWGNAVAAFEKLTTDLPARDTLLPRSYWYLAHSHGHRREHLLAAQSFSRLYESFPDDTLADDAALHAARSYRRLWRKPTLDATYGETSLATYNAMLGLYPDSDSAAVARREILELEEWFATKAYETGRFYLRRKAYDSAIIYFTNVVERWPHVPRARDALLSLAEAYSAIRYRADFDDTCSRLVRSYPGDAEVAVTCRGARIDSTAAQPSPPPNP